MPTTTIVAIAPARRDAESATAAGSVLGHTLTLTGARTHTGETAEHLAEVAAGLCVRHGAATLAVEVTRLPAAYRTIAEAVRTSAATTAVVPYAALGRRPLTVLGARRIDDPGEDIAALLEAGKLTTARTAAPWMGELDNALAAWTPEDPRGPGCHLVAALALVARASGVRTGTMEVHVARGQLGHRAHWWPAGSLGRLHRSQRQPGAGLGAADRLNEIRGDAPRPRPRSGRTRINRGTDPGGVDVTGAVQDYLDDRGLS